MQEFLIAPAAGRAMWLLMLVPGVVICLVVLSPREPDQFLVFRDADTQRLGVIYKRNDGNYGLIEP